MKTDIFQSCGHCWVFQICWYIECSTFTTSSFKIWNSSDGIPSPQLALFVVMLSTLQDCSRWVITPLRLSWSRISMGLKGNSTETSLALFGIAFLWIGMNTDLFQSCGHCWVFQICWHIECSTFTASSYRIWNSSTGIPSPPLALFVVWRASVCLGTCFSEYFLLWWNYNSLPEGLNLAFPTLQYKSRLPLRTTVGEVQILMESYSSPVSWMVTRI